MNTRLILCVVIGLVTLPDRPALGVDDEADRRAQRRTPIVEVFEASRDAVVNISTTEEVSLSSRSPFDGLLENFFDMPRRGRERTFTRESVGSGFVLHADGYIVTNAHVVARTTQQRVTFSDGRVFDARVIASDPRHDLAVLKVDAPDALPTLPLGRSDDLMIGETVVAIGNPFGYQNTVTAGVVSAIGRELVISPRLSFDGLIQTDASINPGNSGGPLLNVLGELIGVNSAIRGDAENIGFAIPVDQLREDLPMLLDVERRYRIQSGLVLDRLGVPRVVDVADASPAARAGLRRGDVLLGVGGRAVNHSVDFDIALISREAGQSIDLKVERDGEPVDLRMRLAERAKPDGRNLAAARLGLELRPVPRRVAEELRLRDRRLQIQGVEPGGPADEAGIEAGDVLLALGRHYVDDLDDLGQLLDRAESGVVVQVEVLRDEGIRLTKRHGPISLR